MVIKIVVNLVIIDSNDYHACVVVLTTVLAVKVQKLATQFELLGCVNVFNPMDHG